jgi:hypothetical protein
MSKRTFALPGDGSQAITITQAGAETPMIVSLNNGMLGMLPPPERLRGVRFFTLDDGSTLIVRAVKKQVQLRHKGLLLSEVRPNAIVADRLSRRILLLLASLALLLGLPGLCLLAIALLIEMVYAAIGLATFFSGCFPRCQGSEQAPAFLASGGTFTEWFVRLAVGGVLFAGITCAIGCFHALSTARWRMAFVLCPLLLLETVGLIAGVRTGVDAFFTTPFLLAVFISFLASVVCLVYAGRLK